MTGSAVLSVRRRSAALVTTQPVAAERFGSGSIPLALRTALLPRLGRFERLPVDARFVVDGTRVRLVPARRDGSSTESGSARSLVTNLAAKAHRARFVVAQPKLDDGRGEEAPDHRARAPSSRRNYPCCPPRVTNIKRAAELLDGTIILPGKEFSLNGALGKRTEAKGFVSAPQIFNGRFEDAVGGGISQVATTLFNAAFFSGIKLVAHQAHQFYISRYPMGREATVSWGGPELIFRNDWPAAILMKLDATDSGITVRFYSTKLGRRVTTTTGKPYDLTTPKTGDRDELGAAARARARSSRRRATAGSRSTTPGRCSATASGSATSTTRSEVRRRGRDRRGRPDAEPSRSLPDGRHDVRSLAYHRSLWQR